MRGGLALVVAVAACSYGRSDIPCDGVLDPGELCDDGDSEDGDGCDCGARVLEAPSLPSVAGQPAVLVEDGAWCWFQDERVVARGDELIVGSISHGGDVQVTSFDATTGERVFSNLHPRLERDDHDAPSLLLASDGSIDTFYTRHDGFPDLYTRTTDDARDALGWRTEEATTFDYDVTYTNPFELGARPDRTLLFMRGIETNPTLVTSVDRGASWTNGAQLIDAGPLELRHDQRPYAKYVSDGDRAVHILYTDGHPLEFGHNSVYHLVYRDGALWRSDGSRVASAGDDDQPAVSPARGTRIYDGTQLPGGQAWVWDAAIDAAGNPVVVFATFPDPARPYFDHRYHYAKWDGSTWHVTDLAFGGTAIYLAEPFYSGGIALDPDDPSIVYFASNVDPATGVLGESLVFELYRATTADDGATWTTTPITSHSRTNNLRPVVPAGHSSPTTLVWMRGSYDSYLDYRTQIVALLGDADATVAAAAAPGTGLVPLARFDLAATADGPPTPPAAGFTSAIPEAGFAVAHGGEISLAVSNITTTLDEHIGDPLYRGAVACTRGGYAPGGKLHVELTGLTPGQSYVVRIHAHETGAAYLLPTLWFLDTATTLIGETNEAFIGAHRNVNAVEGGEGATDFILGADEAGRIGLLARGLNESGADTTAVLAGLEVFAEPVTDLVASFDVTAPGHTMLAGAAPLWFDDTHEWSASATQNGITFRVTSDRVMALRDRDDTQWIGDFVFGRDGLVLDVGGLEVGALYEITVYSTDLDDSLFDASRWRLDEPGAEPEVVRGFHINFGLRGPGASFTFFHRAGAAGFRLRGEDLVTSLSSNPSIVAFNAIEIRRAR